MRAINTRLIREDLSLIKLCNHLDLPRRPVIWPLFEMNDMATIAYRPKYACNTGTVGCSGSLVVRFSIN